MMDEQWHGDKIEPYYVEDMCIYPPWNKPVGSDGAIKEILLDPGVVFGTGRHQTTEDCLYLIHRVCTNHKIKVLASLSDKNVHILERRCPDGIWNTLLGKI